MKTINVLLIGLFVILLSSCSKDSESGGGGFDPSDCEMGNGVITANISGNSNYRKECIQGTYFDIGGFRSLTMANASIINVDQNSVTLEDYLVVVVSLPNTKSSGCISDQTELNSGGITYWEGVTIGDGLEAEDHPGFFRAIEQDVEICLDEFTAERATGTFSGTLRNNFGDTKTITSGKFDFEF